MASPIAAGEVFTPGKGFHKTEGYGVVLAKPVTDIFTEHREHVHAVKKRIASPFYSLATIQQQNARIESLMNKFLSKIDEFANAKERVDCDLGSWLHYLAFDVSLELS